MSTRRVRGSATPVHSTSPSSPGWPARSDCSCSTTTRTIPTTSSSRSAIAYASSGPTGPWTSPERATRSISTDPAAALNVVGSPYDGCPDGSRLLRPGQDRDLAVQHPRAVPTAVPGRHGFPWSAAARRLRPARVPPRGGGRGQDGEAEGGHAPAHPRVGSGAGRTSRRERDPRRDRPLRVRRGPRPDGAAPRGRSPDLHRLVVTGGGGPTPGAALRRLRRDRHPG